MHERCEISILNGKVLRAVKNTKVEIVFETVDGETFALHHEQECCENVHVEDVCGDLQDLVGVPILEAEEVSNEEEERGPLPDTDTSEETYTWTFYKLRTMKGSVTIRFYGSSLGHYSEGVDFIRRAE